MEMFRSLFGKLLVFVYHCYDRIVIQGHLPLLSREGQIVYFFRDVRGEYPITDKVLAGRTNAYRAWVDSYARDEVLGPIAMCVGTYLPCLIFYYVNGHHYIENELKREKVAYRKDDNAFLWVADPQALQAAADRLSEEVLRKRLDYWTFALGPKFSEKERARVKLYRDYSINQVEYCRNFIFQRNAPIHKIFERSCEMGLQYSTWLIE